MRFFGLISVAVIAIVATSSRAWPDASPSLTGKMSQLNYLVGSWTCTTKIPAFGKAPAQTITATVTHWIEPSNVIGSHYSSRPYSSAGFTGWMASKKLWWSDGGDEGGATTFETGADSGTNVQVMTGTLWYQGQTSTVRDTMTKISDSSYSDFFQGRQGGKVIFEGKVVCTKSSASARSKGGNLGTTEIWELRQLRDESIALREPR